MKNKVKGFTLTECIVAMAILAVASLTMAQIYASVATKNRMNNLVNTSLSNQMAYVEKVTNSEAVKGDYDTTGYKFELVKAVGVHVDASSGSVTKTDKPADEKYEFPVDFYVLHSRDRQDQKLNDGDSDAGYKEKDYNLRYKYLLGHSS